MADETKKMKFKAIVAIQVMGALEGELTVAEDGTVLETVMGFPVSPKIVQATAITEGPGIASDEGRQLMNNQMVLKLIMDCQRAMRATLPPGTPMHEEYRKQGDDGPPTPDELN